MSEVDSTGGTSNVVDLNIGKAGGNPAAQPMQTVGSQNDQVLADAALGKIASFTAKFRRASYLALVKEGFTEQQALDLCWR